jgi:hypothetical protein
MEKPRRSTVRESDFEEQLVRLIPNVEEADDFTLGAEVILSIDPEAGAPTEDGVWILPMFPVDQRDVYLYYTFDEETVWLMWIVAT